MYGQGGGEVLGITTGTAATVTGIAVLPNTGGNTYIMLLGLFSLIAGIVILGSFTAARIAGVLYRNK